MKTNQKKLNIKFTLKIWKQDETVQKYYSTKIRRIIAKVKADKFLKAYIKVSYGKGMTNKRKREEIYNDGIYDNPKELLEALSAFTERSLLEDTEKWVKIK